MFLFFCVVFALPFPWKPRIFVKRKKHITMTKKEIQEEIGKLVVKFSTEEMEALLRALQKQYLLSKAERLERSVVENKIGIQEVVEEVRKVRQKRYESS